MYEETDFARKFSLPRLEDYEDGVNGFLVDSVDQAAERIVQLLRDRTLRERLGAAAQRTVAERFLMSRLMEEWLDLIEAFEPRFPLRASAR